MPGVSIIYKKGLDQSLISESLDDFEPKRNYEVKKLFQNNNFMLALSGYEGYPNQYFEDDNTIIFVEGLIYNKKDSEIESLLKAISKSYIEGNDYKNLIKEFIDHCDGDFDVLIYFRRLDELVIFNDRWGRLPSYYYCDDDVFIFSRELSFILKFIPLIQFDKVSMVEFLVFEYTLGDRTLIKNIHRVSPSCMFNLEPSESVLRINMEKVFDVNFEESPRTLSKNDCIERCKDLFLQSISYRINKMKEKKYRMTADLSGGYDTRVVLAGLCKFDAKVDYFTDRLVTGDESEYAERVAALYNRKPIRTIASHNVNYSDMSRITYMTDCTVNGWTALSCYNDSLERLKQVRDVAARFMGFGGEFIRHPYKEIGHYKTLADMLRDGHFVLRLKIRDACSIMNLGEESFFDNLTAYFNEYPEPALRDKVKHFYFEYYNNAVNAGENRARLHFWTVQPLWSKDLFSFEMKYIPAKYIGFHFFIGFMRVIDPILLDTPIYRSNLKLNSKTSLYKAALKRRLADILRSNWYLYKLILYSYKFVLRIVNPRGKARPTDVCGGIKRDLLENYTKLNILASYLDEKSVHEFIENEYKDVNLYMLMTLVLYFREIENRYGDKVAPCTRL